MEIAQHNAGKVMVAKMSDPRATRGRPVSSGATCWS
jgi:hypothetical protein